MTTLSRPHITSVGSQWLINHIGDCAHPQAESDTCGVLPGRRATLDWPAAGPTQVKPEEPACGAAAQQNSLTTHQHPLPGAAPHRS